MHKQTVTYLNNAIEVIESMEDYWPLTLRQIYYQLVAAGLIDNNRNQYQKLSRVLSQARLDNLVSWDAMEDRSRSILYSGGYDDIADFKKCQLDSFLEGYNRDLLQSQPIRPEIWVEKDALSHLVHDVACAYCIHVVAAKGFSSMTFKNECRNRILENAKVGQDTLILYFGDLDASGVEMLPAMMRTLHNEMDLIGQVESKRIALNPDQVKHYKLPVQFDALKDTDTRAKKYRERFGSLAVELDALKLATLKELVKEAIEANLDLSLFNEERLREQDEREDLTDLKNKVWEIAA